MSKPRSLLYRLIEAGQLTHKALLAPMLERGLEPGDDAVLLLLGDSDGVVETELTKAMGLASDALTKRLERLITRDLVLRRAIGPQLLAGFALTERGARLYEVLTENWRQLEAALLDDLKPKHRKQLRDTLGQFIEKLRA